MAEELERWDPKGVRIAQVGDWAVYGVGYENENGKIAWHTTSYPNENPIHHFWVMDGKFRSMAIHYMYNLTNENRIWIGNEVEIDGGEKKAIEHAIAKWEGKALASYRYRVIEKTGSEEWSTVASGSGFPTEDDAKAAGEREAQRISQAFGKTLTVDVEKE